MTFLLKEFLEVLKKEKIRALNFWLLFSCFVLLPSGNYYQRLDLEINQPVVAAQKSEFIPPSFYPINFTGRQPDWLSARSTLVIDLDSRAILFAKNPDWQLMPASTTKIMTALVILEAFPLHQVIRVEEPSWLGQVMRLKKDEEITVKNLLYGLLVQSANDAAEVLAANFPGGKTAFIKRMNQKADELYLQDTHFTNPMGVEEFGHYSTVHDLAILAAFALKDQTFREMVATEAITVSDVSGEIQHSLENINELLGEVRGIKGVKTGWTERSGECLVSFVEREGQQIITVVLGSQDRFGETRYLIEWAFANHQWQAP